MAEFYFAADLDGGAKLVLAPLTDDRIEETGDPIPDPSGHFLYSVPAVGTGSIKILAQIPSAEAAVELSRLLGLR